MIRKLKEALAFFKGGCWKVDMRALGFLRRAAVNFIRFISTTILSFGEHRCGLHAAGLTYFMILGFVPVLCMLMVCAKTCGLGSFAREKVNEQIDLVVSSIEKGKEEAMAAAAEVASPEKIAAVTNEADAQKKEDAPAPAEPADAQKKEDVPAPAESADALKKLTDVPVLVADKEKMALYKARASKELAEQLRKFSNEMFDVIDKVDLTTLGWIGFAVLMWTVVSTLGHVETAVNDVWHVRKHRPIWRKFIVYLFVVVALPFFMSLAVSLPMLRLVKTVLTWLKTMLDAASYTRWVGDALDSPFMTRWVWDPLDGLLMSRVVAFSITLTFSSLAFAVLLKMMPNRRVSFRSAFYAGVFTSLLVGGWMVLCTKAGVGISRSSAMYGSFAVLPILLAWIYMSWQLVLLGSCMSYAFECVHRGTPVLPDR